MVLGVRLARAPISELLQRVPFHFLPLSHSFFLDIHFQLSYPEAFIKIQFGSVSSHILLRVPVKNY